MELERTSVLIVDDEVGARETLQAVLFNEGYELSFATGGQEALEQIGEVQPDVILLDVMMPDMDGFQVCRTLKDDPQWRHVPIILVTALDGKQDLATGLDAGGDDFISKPVVGLELRARVRSLLRVKRQHDQLEAQRRELESMLELKTELARVTAQRLEELELLYDVGLRLVTSLEEDYVIWQVGLTALQLLPEAQHCVMYLLSEDEQALSAAALVDREGSVQTYPWLGAEDWVWRTIMGKEAVYVPEVSSEVSCEGSPLKGLRTLALSPLLVDKRCIGVIGADSTSPDAFDLAQQRLLSILANQAAVTMMKARLVDELNRPPANELESDDWRDEGPLWQGRRDPSVSQVDEQ